MEKYGKNILMKNTNTQKLHYNYLSRLILKNFTNIKIQSNNNDSLLNLY